jgi:hypothetical protein
MFQTEPWNPGSGYVAPLQMISRLVANLSYFRALEDLLTNDATYNSRWAILPGLVLAALFLIGCRRLFLSGRSALLIYMILFGITVSLAWPDVVPRYLIPVLPIVFACVVAGIQAIAQKTNLRIVYAIASYFLLGFLVSGFRTEISSVAQERGSPFPNEIVKYPGNYDLQRIALWWKQNTPTTELAAYRQPNVLRVITGRPAVRCPVTSDPTILENYLHLEHTRFLFLDLTSDRNRRLADILEHEQNEHFHLINRQPKAQLYELAE